MLRAWVVVKVPAAKAFWASALMRANDFCEGGRSESRMACVKDVRVVVDWLVVCLSSRILMRSATCRRSSS